MRSPLLVALGFVLLTRPALVWACDCAVVPSVAKEVEGAEVVAVVRVLSVTEDRNVISLDVEQAWRGARVGDRLAVTGRMSSCGYAGLLQVGTEHLVYLHRTGGELIAHDSCGRSTTLARAAEDIRELDRLGASLAGRPEATASSAATAAPGVRVTTEAGAPPPRVAPAGVASPGASPDRGRGGCAQAPGDSWAPWWLLLSLALVRRGRGQVDPSRPRS